MGVLQDAILTVTGESPALTAAGRTDAGAHAHGQVAGIALERSWAPDALRHALNAVLPADLAVRDAAVAPDGFHARRDAVERSYRYLIVCRDGNAPISRRTAWTVRGHLDVDAMRLAAQQLVGTHDFAAFGSAPRPGGSTVRTVTSIDVNRHAFDAAAGAVSATPILETVIITVSANAFLRGMMRSFTGALVKIGRGRASAEWLGSLLENATQREPSVTVAPARGLHQWSVRYATMRDTDRAAHPTQEKRRAA
jgi:tRNA pseudouridine38-40 synthase